MIDPVTRDTEIHLAKQELAARQQDEAECAADSRMKMVDADEAGKAMFQMGGREVRFSFLVATAADDAELGRLVREIIKDFLFEDELSALERDGG